MHTQLNRVYHPKPRSHNLLTVARNLVTESPIVLCIQSYVPMKTATIFSIGIALVLVLSGCQDSLQSPAQPADAELSHAVRSAKASYNDRPAVSKGGYDRYSEVRNSFVFGTILEFEQSDAPPAETFQALRQKADALIAAHRGDPVGPMVARFVSGAMLGVILHNSSKMRDVPEKTYYEALREYLQMQVDLRSTEFRKTITALKALSGRNPSMARTLAGKALSNFRGFSAYASEPVDIPTRLTEMMPWRAVQNEESMIQEKQRNRLQYYRERGVEQQLAELAGAS